MDTLVKARAVDIGLPAEGGDPGRVHRVDEWARCCVPGGDTRRVLKFAHRHAVLLGDDLEWFAGLETAEHVLDSGAAVGEHRLPEAAARVCDHLGVQVLREPDQLRVAVRGVLDPVQLGVHDLVEHPLVVAHHDQVAGAERRRVSPACSA